MRKSASLVFASKYFRELDCSMLMETNREQMTKQIKLNSSLYRASDERGWSKLAP